MFCLSPFCYVCLTNKEELFNLNNLDGDLMRLWDKLLYCMPGVEEIDVDIPLFICRECRTDLRVAYTFRKKFVTNFPFVDDYIRQLTYVDGLLVAVEHVEEHADLCVTLVDFVKRCQQSRSTIKTETNDDQLNSVEIEQANQSIELQENECNWESLTSSIENPTKRQKHSEDVSILTGIIHIQDDASADNSVDVKDISLAEINEHNHDDLDAVSNNVVVQKANEEQAVEMLVDVSTLQDVMHEEREFTLVEQNNPLEEAKEDINSRQSPSMEQAGAETNTENGTTLVNTLNLEESNQNKHLQITIHVSSDKNIEENASNQEKSTSKQLNTLVHAGNGKAAISVEQLEDSKAIPSVDSVTNELFKAIRNTNKIRANDDTSSRPSVATSMYESDVIDDDIDWHLSDNSAEYISDNDDTSVNYWTVSGTCRRDYADISSPNNIAENTSVTSEIHQLSSESGCREPSSTPLVQIKHPVSDVEDNYSNETVLYRDTVQENTTDSVAASAMTSFSFMKAYLQSTTDTNTNSKDCQTESSQSEQITTNATDESSQSVSPADEHLNNNQITNSSTEGKSVSAECKKTVYTSIRKKIPRLIDLNGSMRKTITPTLERLTIGHKYSHSHQVYRLANCQTSNCTNVQQEIHQNSRDITNGNVQQETHTINTNVQQETHKDSTNATSVSTNIPAKSTSETCNAVYKCTVCDATFKYQSLLECHVEEKHTRRQELLPEIIIQDEQLIRNNRLATYRIPHVNKNKSVGTGDDRVDNTQRLESDAIVATSQRRISVTENVDSPVTNKHKVGVKNSVGVDVATNTVNSLSIKDKQSASAKVSLNKLHAELAGQQTSNPVTIGAQLKRHKSTDSKDSQSKNSVLDKVKSQKKHHHSSASSQSKKKSTNHSSKKRRMIDKAIGTIDFTENSTGIYAFTDVMEENMYRIRADENNNHSDQSSRQQVAKKVTNKVKLHKEPDLVHYYQTTEHLSSDKHATKSLKKSKAQASSRRVEKVDKSTETSDLIVPRIQPVINNVVKETSGGSSEPETNITTVVRKESTKCSLCANTFADMNSLREHLIIEHKTYKKFQCTLCEKYFRQRCRLLYHMVNTHAKAQLHVCTVCDKNFSCTATLNRHMRIHYGDKPYKCTVCDKAFRYKESVKTHMVLHTGVKAYRCPYCDRTFSFKGNMIQHVQTHTRDRRYPCPMCDKDFCTNTVMKQHMRTHTGERPYKCPTCARAFTVRQTMIQHMSVHTDVKPHPCTMCPARFKQKQHLRRHMYVHTEDKPYKCTVCDKAFRLEAELSKHASIHENTQQPYTCDICNIGYANSDQLYAHNFNVHYKKDINLVTIANDST